MLIGIYGRKRSGKNTLANAIAQQVPGTSILSFAAPLKELCMKVFGLTEEQVDGEEKEQGWESPLFLDDWIPFVEQETGLKLGRQFRTAFSPRQVLQYLGTDYIRDAQEDFWLRTAEFALDDLGGHAVFSDVRFSNEAEFIRSRGGIVLETVRLGLEHLDPHPSENDEVVADFTLKVKSGEADALYRRAALLLKGVLK